MIVHNQQEELVMHAVNQVFDEDKSREPSVIQCHCDECMLDVVCYALNRISPRYTVSERGFAHRDAENSPQTLADLYAIITEGMERVSATKRPHLQDENGDTTVSAGLNYHFPVITGNLLNGVNFEPIENGTIRLLQSGASVPMSGPKWQNPVEINKQTAGRFGFWPRVQSSESDERTSFEFCLIATTKGFEETRHFFTLHLKPLFESSATPTNTHSLGDIYVFPT